MIRRRVAIHLHVFYPEMLEELVACIHNIETVCGKERVDVVATCPVGRDDVRERICELLPAAHVVEVPNAGYDVWPFFEVLDRINLVILVGIAQEAWAVFADDRYGILGYNYAMAA